MTDLSNNMAKAAAFLAQFKAGVLNHIDGKACESQSGRWFTTSSPTDLSQLARITQSDASDVDASARVAHAAFAGWSATTGQDRRAILHAIADGIIARAEEIAFVECMDTGQALRFMEKAALRGAENFRYFADRAPEARDGQTLQAKGQVNITSRKPIGPVGVITPWNTPFMLSTWKIAPALAAGCSVVHKPAELSPLTASLLVQIAEDAGLPAGVWNVVHGLGEEAGRALTEHPMIKAISFVGETKTGRRIMAQGAATLKRVHFELGGKNPVIVFADADLDRAVDAVVFMIYSLNGQRCTSSSRLLVESTIAEDFCADVAARANKIVVGHPLDPATEIGPLIHPDHEAKVLSYIGLAKSEGAFIAAGGTKVPKPGCYVTPTLITQARGDMRVAREEIFGPVLTAMSFDDEAQAVQMANDVEYGLAAYLWTQDVTRAFRVSDALEAGMVWVNSENLRHLPAPFGGQKNSGIGRDGGDWSFDFYMETKNIAFATVPHVIPKMGKL